MLSNALASVQFAQIARVDEVVRKRGWNLVVADDLARELGVDRRTIYRHRGRAQAWTQKHLSPQDIERWRLEQVVLLGDTAREARDKGDFAATARCIEIQAKIIGTIAPTKVDVTSTVSVVHSAAVARLSTLSMDELRQMTEPRQIVDAVSVPVADEG